MTTLADILVLARQESVRMLHHFLGVEHLFIALLDAPSGITRGWLQQNGAVPDAVIEAIRRHTGKGGKHILWAGIPHTPRLEVVLSIAQDLALEDGRDILTEMDLLRAIIDENENVPVRVLKSYGFSTELLRASLLSFRQPTIIQSAVIRVDFSDAFVGSVDPSDLYLFRKIFADYESITINSLIEAYDSTSVFVVFAHQDSSTVHSTFLVKLGQSEQILSEWLRIERVLDRAFPRYAAHPDIRPVIVAERAALRYVVSSDAAVELTSLRDLLLTNRVTNLGEWLLTNLALGAPGLWWQMTSAHELEVWQEYDWMLPALFNIRYSDMDEPAADAFVIKDPVLRSRLSSLRIGDRLTIEKFTVQEIDPAARKLVLAMGLGDHTIHPYRIVVSDIDLKTNVFFRGEVIDRISGTVLSTRENLIMAALSGLEPDFDITADSFQFGAVSLPNPAQAYQWLLGVKMTVYGSIVHGSLRSTNLFLSSKGSTRTFDYANCRWGHIMLDWAYLLTDVFGHLFTRHIPNDWNAIRNSLGTLWSDAVPAPDAFNPSATLKSLTQVVHPLFSLTGQARDFYVALAFIALQIACDERQPQAVRRVQFLLAAYAIWRYREQY